MVNTILADDLVGDGSERMLLGIPDPCRCYVIFRIDFLCPKLILVPNVIVHKGKKNRMQQLQTISPPPEKGH